MAVPGAPAAGVHIVFQGGVPAGHPDYGLHRPAAQAGPAQVGVEGHAGAVDHAPQAGQGSLTGPAAYSGAQVLSIGNVAGIAGQNTAAQGLQLLPHGLPQGGGGHLPCQRLKRLHAQQLVHLGDGPQHVLLFHTHTLLSICVLYSLSLSDLSINVQCNFSRYHRSGQWLAEWAEHGGRLPAAPAGRGHFLRNYIRLSACAQGP